MRFLFALVFMVLVFNSCGGGGGSSSTVTSTPDQNRTDVSNTLTTNLRWSNPFFGLIQQLQIVDIDHDGKNEIVGGGELGIFVLNADGSIIWEDKGANRVDSLFVYNADSDPNLEFATVGWLDIKLFDDNGSHISTAIMKKSAGFKLPATLLNGRLVSHYNDYVDDTQNGLRFGDAYDIFYPSCESYGSCQSLNNIPSNGLASVDSDNDGRYDLLYGIADNNTSFKLDQEGKEIWSKELAFYPNYIWAGKLSNGTQMQLIASLDGYIEAFDHNGVSQWQQRCSDGVERIIYDSNGGFLVHGTPNICKLSASDGSIEWNKSDISNIAQNDQYVAVSKNASVEILTQEGSLLSKANISSFSSEYYSDAYLHPSYLEFGKLTDTTTLFVGSLDIHTLSLDGRLNKRFAGGSLITKIGSTDMSGDGSDEIVAQDEHRLYLYNSEGSLLWSKDRVSLFDNIKFADFTGNGKSELIAINDSNITIFDLLGNTLWSIVARANIVDVYDYNQDGANDLFVAEYDKSIKVYSGKSGTLIHNFGDVEYSCNIFLKVLDVAGETRLYYEDNGKIYWTPTTTTLSSRNTSSLNTSWSYGYEYVDYNSDGVLDIVNWMHDGTNLILSIYDPVSNRSLLSLNIASDATINDLKLSKLRGGNEYELLLVSDDKVSLHQMNGTLIWEFEKSQRNLSNIKIIGEHLYVAGKEVYLLNNKGELIQELSPTTYMSADSYYVQTTLSNSSSDEMQLIIASMGLYSYDALK